MGRCGEHEAQGTGSGIKHAPDLTVRGKESELHERKWGGRKGKVDVHESVNVIVGKGSPNS